MQARSWTSSKRVYESIARSMGWMNANKQGCHVDRNCCDNLYTGLRRRSSLTSVRSPSCGISSANIKFARGLFPPAPVPSLSKPGIPRFVLNQSWQGKQKGSSHESDLRCSHHMTTVARRILPWKVRWLPSPEDPANRVPPSWYRACFDVDRRWPIVACSQPRRSVPREREPHDRPHR